MDLANEDNFVALFGDLAKTCMKHFARSLFTMKGWTDRTFLCGHNALSLLKSLTISYIACAILSTKSWELYTETFENAR